MCVFGAASAGRQCFLRPTDPKQPTPPLHPRPPPLPRRPGNLTITSSDSVPLLAPVGPYSMRMQAWDQAGAGVMCVDIWFRIESAPSTRDGRAGGGGGGGFWGGLGLPGFGRGGGGSDAGQPQQDQQQQDRQRGPVKGQGWPAWLRWPGPAAFRPHV